MQIHPLMHIRHLHRAHRSNKPFQGRDTFEQNSDEATSQSCRPRGTYNEAFATAETYMKNESTRSESPRSSSGCLSRVCLVLKASKRPVRVVQAGPSHLNYSQLSGHPDVHGSLRSKQWARLLRKGPTLRWRPNCQPRF